MTLFRSFMGSRTAVDPTDNDRLVLLDAEDTSVTKATTWARIKTVLSSVFVPATGGTFTGAVTVPDATADGHAIAYDQEAFRLSGNTAEIEWHQPTAPANQKRFRIRTSNGVSFFQAADDAGAPVTGPSTASIKIAHSDGGVDMTDAPSVTVPDATADGQPIAYDQANWRLGGGQTGRLTVSETGLSGLIELKATGNAADKKHTRIQHYGGNFYVQPMNDVGGVIGSPFILEHDLTVNMFSASAVEVPTPTASTNPAPLVRTPDATTGDLGLPGYAGSDTGRRNVTSLVTYSDGGSATVWLRRTGNTVTLEMFGPLFGAGKTGITYAQFSTSSLVTVAPAGFTPNTNVAIQSFSAVGGNILDSMQINWNVLTGGGAGGGYAVYDRNVAHSPSIYMTATWTTIEAWPSSLPGTQASPPVAW